MWSLKVRGKKVKLFIDNIDRSELLLDSNILELVKHKFKKR